jgi:hypothetical protein
VTVLSFGKDHKENHLSTEKKSSVFLERNCLNLTCTLVSQEVEEMTDCRALKCWFHPPGEQPGQRDLFYTDWEAMEKQWWKFRNWECMSALTCNSNLPLANHSTDLIKKMSFMRKKNSCYNSDGRWRLFCLPPPQGWVEWSISQLWTCVQHAVTFLVGWSQNGQHVKEAGQAMATPHNEISPHHLWFCFLCSQSGTQTGCGPWSTPLRRNISGDAKKTQLSR